MATDNNSQINSFAAGLDADSSIDRVQDGSYLSAMNVRVIQYDEGNRNGSIVPIPGIKLAGKLIGEKVYRVLAAGTIRQYGVIVYISKQYSTPQLRVARFENKIGGNKDTGNEFNPVNPVVIFSSKLIDWPTEESEWPDAVSISFKYEDKDNIKLYIATSFNPILVINIVKKYSSVYDIDAVSSYPSVLFNKPVFFKYITGAMNPGLVSYSYQLYNDYGVATDISPACQQIPVINVSKTDSTDVLQLSGSNYGKKTTCGIQVFIPALSNPNLGAKFDKIKIFRITVQQNGQIPTIEIIYDSIFDKTNIDGLFFNDVGQEPLDQITPEEYNSMSGVHIIPNSIENKDQLLFAANVTEKQTFIDGDKFKGWDARAYRKNTAGLVKLVDPDTEEGRQPTDGSWPKPNADGTYDEKVYKDAFNPYNDINKQSFNSLDKCIYDSEGYFGGSGTNVSWRFILTYIPIDTCEVDDNSLPIGTLWNVLRHKSGIEKPKCFFVHKYRGLEDAGISVSDERGRITESWLTKSLRRDELYRYGIILYDKTGNPSPVKWIADIRTPNLYDDYFNTFISHYKAQDGTVYDLASLPLGVAFNVRNLPEGCTGYEIVRCARREQDIATVSQGVISKPIVKYMNPATKLAKSTVYFPTGLLTTAMVAQGVYFQYFWDQNYDPDVGSDCVNACKTCATNFGNDKILQFVSPEVVYQPESMKTVFNGKDYRLQPLRYLFGSSAAKLDGKSYNTMTGRMLTRNYLRPGISNINLFTMPGNKSSASQPWKYYYIDENGVTKNKDYVTDPYMLKMETQSAWHTYYEASPYMYSIGTYISNWIANIFMNQTNNISIWGYTKPGKISNPVLSKTRGHIDQFVFAYVKLYEQAQKLMYVRTDEEDSFKHLELVENGLITDSTTQYDINNIEIASDLQWNEVIKMSFQEKGTNEDTKDSGRWWPTLEYKNHIDSVGQYQFCNAVMYGTDGALVDKGGTQGDDKWSYAYDIVNGAEDPDPMAGFDYPTIDGQWHTLNAPYAAGGRCAILQINEKGRSAKNLTVTNTIGALTHFENDNNNLKSVRDWSYKRINIESIAGTMLCNIRKNVTPYNGYTNEAREQNVYYSTGQYFKASNNNTWNAVFDGDVVISVLDYTAMHKAPCQLLNPKDATKQQDMYNYRSRSMMVGYAIPVESSINCRLSGGHEFSRESTNDGFSQVQIQPSNIQGMYSQLEPEYVYNTAYSSEDKVRVHASFDSANANDFNKTIDYRARHSNLKENNEHIDSWTKFQSSNFIDVDTQYGPITNIRDFKQQLLFWQQKAFGALSVNERAVTTDDSGNSIILGDGGVLSRYDYVDTTSGMHKQQFCDTQSETTLYWFDHHNNEIKCYSGQELSLTKKFLVQSLMEQYKADDQIPKLLFDPSYNEMIGKTLAKDWSIVYNENINKFTSLSNIQFNESLVFPNGVYFVKGDDDLSIAQWNADNTYTTTWGEEITRAMLTFATNKYPTTAKVFDNQEIVTPQNECSLIGKTSGVDKNAYFSSDHQYIWHTETQTARDTLEDKITLREHNYRYSVPRQVYSGIYGARMRGKYLTTFIENYKPRTDVAIQYVITKFRTSWS